MTDIKNWFDTEYPQKKDRENLTEIHLSEKDFEGKLDLKQEELPKLERIFYSKEIKLITPYDIWVNSVLGQKKLKGIQINCYHNVELFKYTPIEEVLEKSYPKNDRDKITKLNLTGQGLRGELELKGFTNLEELRIELSHPWHLKGGQSNFITDLDLTDSAKLKKITLINNPVQMNLEEFDSLTDLEELNISQDDNNTDKWIGSLDSLKDLPLKTLNISYNKKITDYDKLPLTITNLKCKGLSFYQQIKPFAFDVKAWKIVNHSKLVKTNKNDLIKELNDKLTTSYEIKQELNEKGLTNDNLLSQIELLEAKNRELLTA